jgi:DNA-binding MarR family transcriptional regulator
MNLIQLQKAVEKLQKDRPDIYKDTLLQSVPFFLLHKQLYDKGNDLLSKKYKLNQTHLDVLSTLYSLGEKDYTLSPTSLYEKLLFSSGGMTKVLKKLEEESLIRRIDNVKDKRSKLVQLTSKGKEKALEALDEVITFEDTYFNKLDKNEREVFSKLLYKILEKSI